MALKRTNVYADENDLDLLKEAAARLGRSEAEMIREAIHRMAMAHRVWDEPFVSDEETFDFGGPITRDDIRASVSERPEAPEQGPEGHAA
ncbi:MULTISPECIES: CopG family transcriptional regulator [Streptomyces]|uniref:CopG family transcriptional regulator n=1 Tax=Streptomyces solicathayae TaxID=3081768 RepID=A0ABZ0LPQ0_9ACTN|nr:CopG family transcriptional regulator [Streptomyces sp. HUAS YS2]WOX21475.1 CopG family transcriptional regulator [Streptomyces sp. HUAS YS2]